MTELGYRAKRRERRQRALLVSAGALGLFATGFGSGWLLHQPSFVPVEGASPTPCITLAVIPADVLPKPAAVSVNVLNGSRRIGMASITAEVLGSRGFDIGDVGNWSGQNVEGIAQIHYGPAGHDAAQLIAAYVDGATMVQDNRTDNTVDLVIGQKFKTVLSAAEAKAVLQRPIASPSGPGC